MDLYLEKDVVIATKHGKERVVAPVLKEHLGINSLVIKDFDTDRFGMFSGEVKRTYDPLSTARKKCVEAYKESGIPRVIASEGSFGPHPTIPFVSADEELLLFADFEEDLEFKAVVINTETNMREQTINNGDQLSQFATAVGFPSHGIILKGVSSDKSSKVLKDFKNNDQLHIAFDHLLQSGLTIQAETDMRACFNPTRMKVIEHCAKNLVEKLKSQCPVCETPGFDVIDRKRGLPCEACGFPTRSVKSWVFACQRCDFKEERPVAEKSSEDPMYCDLCNP